MAKAVEEQNKQAQKQQEEEKKKQKDTTLQFYESLRQGNLGLLKAKDNQTIG